MHHLAINKKHLEKIDLIEQYFEDGFPFVEIMYNGVTYALHHEATRMYGEKALRYIQNGVAKEFQYDKIEEVNI